MNRRRIDNVKTIRETEGHSSKEEVIVGMVSQMSSKYNEITLPMSKEEFEERNERFLEGEHVQDAFDNLSKELREFVFTGITPDEWEETFTLSDTFVPESDN